MDKTLKVIGKASLSIKPDSTNVKFVLTKTKTNYEALIVEVDKDTNLLKDILVNLGFIRTAIKTKNFMIEPNYEQIKDNDGKYIDKLTGYKYIETINISFNKDHKLLTNILNEVAKTNLNPQINIEYSLKAENKLKADLLNKAVKDAKNKAKILAKAAGIILGDIISINYDNNSNLNLVTRPSTNDIRPLMMRNKQLDFEPNDITVNDFVTLLYEIRT